jgi:hypothetical protein
LGHLIRFLNLETEDLQGLIRMEERAVRLDSWVLSSTRERTGHANIEIERFNPVILPARLCKHVFQTLVQKGSSTALV